LAEVLEDLSDFGAVPDRRDVLHPAGALGTGEHVEAESALHHFSP
jgi:hypothetical protein